jgi:hypothetical protein
MAISWQMLEEEATRILKTCAPCQTFPLRIVATELIPAFRGQRGFVAWTQTQLDRIVRPYIADAPPGRFVAIVYDRAKIEEWGVDGDALRRHWIALQLHEWAHAIELRFQTDYLRRDLPGESVERDAARMATRANVDPQEMTGKEREEWEAFSFSMHDGRFVRTALHLAHRAQTFWKIGRITPGMVCWTTPGRSHPDRYAAALGDEPAGRIADPFEAIMASEPPTAFSELFERDKKRREVPLAQSEKQLCPK